MSLREQIKELALSLSIGDSIRCVCPKCQQAETSFTVTRQDEGLIYNCYRLTCNLAGFIGSLPGSISLKRKPQKTKAFVRPLRPLTEGILTTLLERYELTSEELSINGFKHDYLYNRLYMPIFTYREAHEVGAVAKDLTGHSKLKAINYWSNTETSGLHYPITKHRLGPIVLVEDILSSVKVARHSRCVALLGTHLTDKMVTELQQQTDHIILALDPDAVTKAFYIKKKYSLFFKTFEVKVLSQDPKDLPDTELQEILE